MRALALAVILGSLAGSAPAADPPAAATQPAVAAVAPRCPVTGDPIDRAVYSYYRSKRVYFATPAARDRFIAAPDEYLDGLRAQWDAIRPTRVQIACPMTREKLDLRLFVEGPEARIFFANDEARTAWGRLAPAEQERRLAAVSTYQTRCPTCDSDINPTVAREIRGQTLYFCCAGCPKVLEDDPAPYLKKVAEQVAANKAAFERAHPPAGDGPTTDRPAPPSP